MEKTSTMNKQEIIETTRKYIIDDFLFGNEAEMVGNDDSFMENSIIDSTGILELIEFIEHTYRFSVKDDELIPENLDSLENLSNYILSKVN